MNVSHLVDAFKKEFEELFNAGLIICGLYGANMPESSNDLSISFSHSLEDNDEIIPGQCHLSVMLAFIFDNRKIPEYFMGVKVSNVVQWNTIPQAIEDVVYDPAGYETNNTPDQYERYVQENLMEIKRALNQPDMSYKEALDAICWGNFEKYESEFEEKRIKRLTN